MSSPWRPPGSPLASGRNRVGGADGLQLQEGDTTTTVAIGKDTYTIGKKKPFNTIIIFGMGNPAREFFSTFNARSRVFFPLLLHYSHPKEVLVRT